MKKLLFAQLFVTISSLSLYSQTYLRTENPKYAQTIYFEDFNSNFNFRNNWTVSSHGLGGSKTNKFYIWVDSTATVYVNEYSSRLELSALYRPGYTTTMWTPQNPYSIIIEDYISGQVQSIKDFSYGVFECNAKFNFKKGSFPAFWLYNDTMCFESKRPEIDIVEMKYDDTNPTYDNNIYYYPYGCGAVHSIDFKETGFNWSTENTYTFKCVWSPNKVEFWIDNDLKHTTYKIDHPNDYPDLKMHIMLSQQLWPYQNSISAMVLPQKSDFNWVKVKSFFLSPEITCPSLICTTGTAIIDIDPTADSITWKLTPTNLFSSTNQGAGKTANINAAGPRGQGKITYTFKMPSNEIFTAEKTFYIGDSGFTPIVEGESTVTCDNALFTEADRKSVYWSVYGPLEIVGQNFGYRCTIRGTGNGYGWVYATNDCGSQRGELFVEVDCGYFLTLTPNPSTGETTVAIESTSKELVVDENEEWEMEVYSEFQELKMKDSKLRGKYQKLQTNGWKEGVYVVRVKYKDIILQEKLLVK